MKSIPVRVERRLVAGLKQFQPVLSSARARDVNESDTILIVSDILAEMFGYNKYTEITSEYAIRGTYCDLAVVIDGKPGFLIEVKAIGLELKDSHARQAVDYAANEGIEWVALTNGVVWKVYRMTFAKPIDHELVLELDLLALNPRSSKDLSSLYLLTREGLLKSALSEYYSHRQVMNRFSVGAILLSDPVLKLIRRELRWLSPGLKVSLAEIRSMLTDEVLKRDIMEDERTAEIRKKIRRVLGKRLRRGRKSAQALGIEPSVSEAEPVLADQDSSGDEAI